MSVISRVRSLQIIDTPADHISSAHGTSSAIEIAGAPSRVRLNKAQGFALIDLLFVCGIIGLLASIALPSMLKAKESAQGASAIGSMRSINSAELTYALTCGNGFYAPALTTLGFPPPGSNEPFLGGGLTRADTVVKSGYTFKIDGDPYTTAPATCNGLDVGEAAQGFIAVAEPVEPTNSRFFATNVNGSIFEHSSSLWMIMPEVGKPTVGRTIQ
jgi:type IV pilus assembly protein PilA